jgi:hypothetical protein
MGGRHGVGEALNEFESFGGGDYDMCRWLAACESRVDAPGTPLQGAFYLSLCAGRIVRSPAVLDIPKHSRTQLGTICQRLGRPHAKFDPSRHYRAPQSFLVVLFHADHRAGNKRKRLLEQFRSLGGNTGNPSR